LEKVIARRLFSLFLGTESERRKRTKRRARADVFPEPADARST
jgi:hypothetical protein